MSEVREEQLDALVAAAPTDIAFEGISVSSDETNYSVSFGEDRFPRVSGAELRQLASEHPVPVTNWFYWRQAVDEDPAKYQFLRWLEQADKLPVAERYHRLEEGLTRSWGELTITVSLEQNGTRVYELSHSDDQKKDDLVAYHHPDKARKLATFDDAERYRPLKSAPSLPTGWLFPSLGHAALLQAVSSLYPVSIHHWHQERVGELAITDWVSLAARQTGIYEVITELDEQAVEWAATACCVDSQCLKRRRWEYSADHDLDVPPGTGEFPCPEPCSLIVAAARQWAILEREEPRSYTYELTPSEHQQLREIIDAVATGKVPEIREAAFDEGANRYRARYLQAKRFGDEDPTDSHTDTT